MITEVFREKSPLSNKDSFILFERTKSSFTFPIHVHNVWELNFVEHAAGAQRIVGDSDEIIGEKDLVLVTSTELKHAWQNGNCRSNDIHEITIQFHPNLFSSPAFQKNQFDSIMKMMTKAEHGLAFGLADINRILPILRMIPTERGFYSVMKFFILLHELSLSEDARVLSKNSSPEYTESDYQMKKILDYLNKNLSNPITIDELAQYMGMSLSTLSRFLKKNTKHNFTDFLQEYRINTVVRELNSNGKECIMDIASRCGFVSQSYFYKIFKKYKGVTPQEYRENYQRMQVII
ncbi:AraC family transcriptional regulator [uncultured Parabacteroides sp.]|uniref:AraC family transcriptional regulator n=1 Tax=uncultured Parabacteroides sp. TaxID=512312 RepID=UPI00259B8F0B|nr:AraC family transcriptional regulator [uncultured Parabacteroides sp.]